MFISPLLQLFKFFLVFSSSSQVFKFCHLHQAQNLTFGYLFNQLLFLPLIFFLLLLSLVFWIDFFWWFEMWHTFHHSGHFLCVHIFAIVILLLASRLNGRLLFSSESFRCYFWHLSSLCWCWHSPWCSQCSSSHCYCCCSFERLLLATLFVCVVLATFATHVLLSTIVNLVTHLLFATLWGLPFNH